MTNFIKPLFLFDADGVLIDSLPTFERVLKESLGTLGYNFLKTKRDFLDLFRKNLYISLSERGVSKTDIIRNFNLVGKLVDFSKIGIFDGIKSMLEGIKSTVNLAIVSSNKESQIGAILKANHIDTYFSDLFGFDAGLSKVKKFKKAMKKFETRRENTYYITDTEGDLMEANEVDIKTIAVGWGWHTKEELNKHRPNYFVETPEELVRLAGKICKKGL